MLKADYKKILLTGEDRPDLFSVHKRYDVHPLVRPKIVAEFHGTPINYETDNGFEECDTNIVPISELNIEPFEFEYGVSKNNFIARYNDTRDIENNTLASFEIKDSNGVSHWINYKLFGAAPSSNIIDGSKIKYIEVLPDIDLEYITDTWRLKENIIIKKPKDEYKYSFTLKLDKETYTELQEDGSIFFKDINTGEVVYRIQKPYAIDSLGVETFGVKYTIDRKIYNDVEYDCIEVSITDNDFIENALFPIIIDPTTSYNVPANASDGEVDNLGSTSSMGTLSATTSTSAILLDKSRSGSTNYGGSIGLFRYNTATLPDDAIIESANWEIAFVLGFNSSNSRNIVAEYYSFTTITTAAWTSAVGNNAISGIPIISQSIGVRTAFPMSNVDSINRTGYTGLRAGISGSYSLSAGNTNYINIASIENTTAGYRPLLTVTYSTPPTAPVVLTPNGGETIDSSVNITWQASTDAEGSAIAYKLEYSANNGSTWNTIIASVTNTSYTWNTSAIADGNQYLVKVTAFESATGNIGGSDQSNAPFTISHGWARKICGVKPKKVCGVKPKKICGIQ